TGVQTCALPISVSSLQLPLCSTSRSNSSSLSPKTGQEGQLPGLAGAPPSIASVSTMESLLAVSGPALACACERASGLWAELLGDSTGSAPGVNPLQVPVSPRSGSIFGPIDTVSPEVLASSHPILFGR